LPRKYRPPAAKRRKDRTTNIPYQPAPPPAEENNSWATEEALDGSDSAVAVDVAPVPAEPVSSPARREAGMPRERHVTRDYSYVRGELAKIVVIAAFLIVALIITSILRN
jgi:hypothetical protein